MFIEVNVMGKFKRKFKKEINKNTEDFDSWFEKNQDRLSGFTVESEATYHKGGNVLVKNCRVWIPILALLCCIAICVAVLLPILLNKGNNDFDLRFGEESVYPSMISDAELQSIIEEYPFISKMHITSQGELKLCDDDSLVFTIIDGEIDTGDNYYLLKVQIEHNKNYEFLYKSVYLNLKNQTVVKDWNVTYGQGINDPSGLFVYFIRLEDSIGQVIYMEVHCFENDINYILNEFI